MDIWTKIQDRLRSEVSAPSYEMWFSSSKLVSESDGRIVISVATDFAKDWIHSKYYKLIKSIADNLTKTNTDIVFVVSKEESSTASQPEEVVAESAKNGQFLNPKYTFSTFVIGNSNKFAH
ncbi:MAG: chromosomal replication initiator protein DnaA, partial [Caldisericia bacterium]|nr:chromosomal replication initiator protein DnaA [Caldisericia bacterium]